MHFGDQAIAELPVNCLSCSSGGERAVASTRRIGHHLHKLRNLVAGEIARVRDIGFYVGRIDIRPPVCTENLIRVDKEKESAKLGQ
jgi:hypothetical protein